MTIYISLVLSKIVKKNVDVFCVKKCWELCCGICKESLK